MAVNHILMQGSGCGSGELKPRHNLPAQLPFSKNSERCSGHFRKKLTTRRRLPTAAARWAAVKTAAYYRSNAGRWICFNACPLMLQPLRINLSQAQHSQKTKVSRLFRQFSQWNRRNPKDTFSSGKCSRWKKIWSVYQLRFGFFIHLIVLNELSMLSLVKVMVVCATCVVSIWKREKHMFASAFSSQDQLSSVTNIC